MFLFLGSQQDVALRVERATIPIAARSPWRNVLCCSFDRGFSRLFIDPFGAVGYAVRLCRRNQTGSRYIGFGDYRRIDSRLRGCFHRCHHRFGSGCKFGDAVGTSPSSSTLILLVCFDSLQYQVFIHFPLKRLNFFTEIQNLKLHFSDRNRPSFRIRRSKTMIRPSFAASPMMSPLWLLSFFKKTLSWRNPIKDKESFTIFLMCAM